MQWRSPAPPSAHVSTQVQRHQCREKKCYSKCQDGEPQVCKYGYPRERCCEPLAKSKITGRNIYRCERKEDEELSPYIPLWLLATGAARSIIKPMTNKSHTPAHK